MDLKKKSGHSVTFDLHMRADTTEGGLSSEWLTAKTTISYMSPGKREESSIWVTSLTFFIHWL